MDLAPPHVSREAVAATTSGVRLPYVPVKPPRAARRRELLRQLRRLPKTLLAIRRSVAEDCTVAALDEHLWAFRGFHESQDDPHYRARQWRKVRLGAIGPHDVVGLGVWELAFMANVSREIEEPILEYSHQNGEGFRFLLPSLARYLGKNHEEAAYAASHGLPWCESPWCAEERRHAAAFARIIEHLTGTSVGRENPNRPKVVTSSEADAVRLVISREAAEWNSSSTYTVMAAHATGDLHHLLRNLARDEVKHLAILGAADRYLFGPRAWRRFADILRQSLQEYGAQKRRRSRGDLMGTNPVTAFEVVVAHVLEESAIRRWMKTLPLATLAAIFDGPSQLPEFEAATVPPERRAEWNAILQEGRQTRENLSRWAPRRRQRALQRRAVEARRGSDVDDAIATGLVDLAGAETAGSRADRRARRQICGLRGRVLRACVLDRLRDYQIRNNRHVLAGRG